MGQLDAKQVLIGVLAGAAVAIPVTYRTATAVHDARSAPYVPNLPPIVAPPEATVAGPKEFSRISHSQQGEDLVVHSVFFGLGVRDLGSVTYLDVGAHDPIMLNNTYFFYKYGARGLLVEPNPSFVEKLKAARPRDKVLGVGIGFDATDEADYYMIGGKGGDALNTFDKETAEGYKAKTKGHHFVDKVIKMPLRSINDVIAENFDGKSPNFISIDVEGLDYSILQSLDLKKFRPEVLCVETVDYLSTQVRQDILALMATNQYSIRGGSFYNTVFVADEVLARAAANKP